MARTNGPNGHRLVPRSATSAHLPPKNNGSGDGATHPLSVAPIALDRPRAPLERAPAEPGGSTKQHRKVHRTIQQAIEAHTYRRASSAVTVSTPPPAPLRKRRYSTLQLDDLEGVAYEAKPIPKHLTGLSGVIKPIPRRKFALSKQIGIAPEQSTKVEFKASTLQVFRRFLVWMWAATVFGLGTLVDILRRRDTMTRRAERLVEAFQRTGGTIIKIGQQLAMRVDVLPYEYCRELAKLLDTVKPFPSELAIQTIERAHGKPLHEVFESFDPVPIGSASIACVYQAVLKEGTKVAVKVRRPGAGNVFAADLQAVKWMLAVVETLTFVRPGLLGNFVREFESSVMEEFDFRKEVRYQDLYRRYARNKKHNRRRSYFTAPRVFFELSTSEVIVQEFSSGIWAWEIVAAVEQNDQAALARMRELNIDPKVVSKRLIWAGFWGSMSSIMFHADPHPANIVVKANNEIVFVDFGACGTITSGKRAVFEELFYHQGKKDVHGMVQCMMNLLEPLPHIDVHEFEKELEATVFDAYCKIWSKHSEWHERTTAHLWLSIFELARRFQIPVNLDTVRVFRANMLYDSLAIRICSDWRVDKMYKVFAKDSAVLAAKKFKKTIMKRMIGGPRNKDLAALSDIASSASRAVFKLKRLINRRGFDFSFMVEKSFFAFTIATKMVFFALLALLVTACVVMLVAHNDFVQACWRVASSKRFRSFLLLVALIGVRRILFRFNDRRVQDRAIS